MKYIVKEHSILYKEVEAYSPEERNRMAFESKRESHGRGNPFNW